MDLSFQRNNMNADELRAELRKLDMTVELLMQKIAEKEREGYEKDKKHRMEISEKERSIRENERQFYEEKEMIAASYHSKKVNIKISVVSILVELKMFSRWKA